MNNFLIVVFTRKEKEPDEDLPGWITRFLGEKYLLEEFGQGENLCIFFNEKDNKVIPTFKKEENCRLILVWDDMPNENVKDYLKNIIDKASEIGIALHTTTGKTIKDSQKDIFKYKRLKWDAEYQHEGYDSIYKTLDKGCFNAIREDDYGAYQETLKQLMGEIKKKSTTLKFSLIKHCIAYLFLPMDIDLQGIEEVRNQEVRHQERDRTSVKYLTKVLEDKRDEPKVNSSPCYYRQKLADLWWMIAKFKEKNSKFENDNPCIKDTQYFVPSSPDLEGEITESILELVDKDADKRTPGQREEMEKLKMLLLELTGLEPNTSSLKSQSSSPIFQFMCLLDCGIKEQRYDNVEQILAYFSKGWEVPSANPNPLKSFHDWFCAIHDCLDRLRKENSS